MHDAAIMARRIGQSLPADSTVRAAFLAQARRFATAARLRGVEVAA